MPVIDILGACNLINCV